PANAGKLKARLQQIRRRELETQWRQQIEFAWPNQRGTAMSREQAELEANRHERLGDAAATAPYTDQEMETLLNTNPGHEAVFMGQLAASYLDGEELKDAHRFADLTLREKARAVVR